HTTKHMGLKSSRWRNRDDVHYTASEARIMEAFRPDYTYYGNYMRNMEAIVDRGNVPVAALESISAIVEECDIRLEPLDKFQYSLPPSGRDDPVKSIRKRCV